MKKIFFFIFIISIAFSCKQNSKTRNDNFTLPSDSLLDVVIRAAIDLDSIPVLREKTFIFPVHQTFDNYELYDTDRVPTLWYIDISKLTKDSVRRFDNAFHKPAFSVSDTSFLMYQILKQKNRQLPSILNNNVKLLSDSTIKRLESNANHTFPSYISFYTPLFSMDLKTVYIQIDHICYGLCGSGWTIVLKKTKGHWIKVDQWGRWVS